MRVGDTTKSPSPTCAVLAVAAAIAAATASAQDVVPPPTWARSVEVIDDGAVIYREPREGSPRRGTVKIGTRLPLLRRLAGDGCSTGIWYQVGRDAFACDAFVEPSPQAPGGVAQPEIRANQLLPNTHAFVQFDGTRAFAHPSDYLADEYIEAYGEGFGLIVTGRTTYDGTPFVQTRRGLWVAAESLRFARGSDFVGVELAQGEPLNVAWVMRRNAPVSERPRGRTVRRAGHRELVRIAEDGPGGTVRLTDGTFMRSRDLARARPSARPASVAPGERWIDVDVTQQVMVAYEGDRAVYATLVSTGRQARTHATPLGEHRIWVKLATSDMDDLERQDVESNYMIEAVPWVQFFEGANGFHAAFWHDDFGRRRSHGCVNLSPRDARWLFGFTGPALPDGWYAILPTDADPGTVVRVRE